MEKMFSACVRWLRINPFPSGESENGRSLPWVIGLCLLAAAAAVALIPRDSGSVMAGTGNMGVCRFAYTSKGYYAPPILASRMNWYRAEGVTVEDVRLGMSAGIAAAEALVTGSADIAAMGDVPAIIALTSSRQCVLIGAYGGGEKMHSLLVLDRSAISGPKDLKGKRIGVQFGSSTHGALSLYLQKMNIGKANVSLLNMPQKDLPEALSSGAIDVLAASEPTPLITLKKFPEARELACLSGLGNDYPTVMVASRAYAGSCPHVIRAVMKCMARGVEMINADPAEAARLTSEITGAGADVEEAVFRRMNWRVRLDEAVIRSLQNTAIFLKSQGKIKEVPDIRALSMTDLIP